MEHPFCTQLEAMNMCMQGFPIIHNHRFAIFHLGILSWVDPHARHDENPCLVKVELLGLGFGETLELDLEKRLRLETFNKETSPLARCPATYPEDYLPIVPNEGPRLRAGMQILVEVLPAPYGCRVGDWVIKEDYGEISAEITAEWHRIWKENRDKPLEPEFDRIPADELGPK
jgi:hypothetical protein